MKSLALLGAVLVAGSAISHSEPAKGPSEPEKVIVEVFQAYKNGNAHVVERLLTERGGGAYAMNKLFATPWAKHIELEGFGWPFEQGAIVGNTRADLNFKFAWPDGHERKVTGVFFLEYGKWRFHDIVRPNGTSEGPFDDPPYIRNLAEMERLATEVFKTSGGNMERFMEAIADFSKAKVKAIPPGTDLNGAAEMLNKAANHYFEVWKIGESTVQSHVRERQVRMQEKDEIQARLRAMAVGGVGAVDLELKKQLENQLDMLDREVESIEKRRRESDGEETAQRKQAREKLIEAHVSFLHQLNLASKNPTLLRSRP